MSVKCKEPIDELTVQVWVLFSCGGNFCEEDKSMKNVKITPQAKISTFTVSNFVHAKLHQTPKNTVIFFFYWRAFYLRNI